MAKLEAGSVAPAFTLPDQDGKPVKLSDFKGQQVIVYFYPADDTPGCKKVMEKYGAWGEKTMYGKKTVGTIRSTFLVGPNGKIQRVWSHVRADGHAAKVLEAISEG